MGHGLSRRNSDTLALAGRLLRQVPVPHQRPGCTQDRRPWPAAPAPAQRLPGSAGVKTQTCRHQVSASRHRTRCPTEPGACQPGWEPRLAAEQWVSFEPIVLSPDRAGLAVWGRGTVPGEKGLTAGQTPRQAVGRSHAHARLGMVAAVRPHQLCVHPRPGAPANPGSITPSLSDALSSHCSLGAGRFC